MIKYDFLNVLDEDRVLFQNKTLLQRNLLAGSIFGASLVISAGAFFVSPWFVVFGATIPVVNFLERRFNLTPLVTRLVSIGVFTLLMSVSWVLAEVCIVLMAIQVSRELIKLYSCCQYNFSKVKIESINFKLNESGKLSRAYV